MRLEGEKRKEGRRKGGKKNSVGISYRKPTQREGFTKRKSSTNRKKVGKPTHIFTVYSGVFILQTYK